MNSRRVVITGIGATTPSGNAISCWQSIVEGKSWLSRNTKFDCSEYKSQVCAKLNLDEKFEEQYAVVVSTKERRRMDEVSYISLTASYDALLDSGLLNGTELPDENGQILLNKFNDIDIEKFGTFIASGIGGIKSFQEGVKTLITKGPNRVSPFFFPMILPNMSAGNVALKFGLKGATMTHVSACASSTHSIGEAFHSIRNGELDCCLAGGAEMSVCEIGFAGFGAMNALSTNFNENPEKASRPLDKDRDGFVIGEGSAVLVLEELEHAKKRNAKIYCEISGFGATCDAFHITSPDSEGHGASRTMEMAINDAKIMDKKIDYINLHATSTPKGDVAEITAVKNTFDGCLNDMHFSSTKSMTGHLLGAAGAIEALFCVKALQEQILPPSINIDNIDDCCEGLNIVKKAKHCTIKTALSNSFGFGGTNGCLVFNSVDF